MRFARSLDINDAPLGKGRPRATVIGGRARIYTPQKTAEWEAAAAVELAAQWDREPIGVPCTLNVWALFPRPKNKVWKTKKMPPYPHTSKPDADNVLKVVCDTLQRAGVVKDDSLIHEMKCSKMVCGGGETPKVLLGLSWEE